MLRFLIQKNSAAWTRVGAPQITARSGRLICWTNACSNNFARIYEPLHFLGLSLDTEANLDNRTSIHADGSKPVLITVNEEEVICELV